MFGLQTQYGGGKTTGFALIYDSPEALKKFEPHYRLVRVGFATKIEKPSRQQRTSFFFLRIRRVRIKWLVAVTDEIYRQATQEQTKDPSRYGKGQGCDQEEGQIDHSLPGVCCGWALVLAGTWRRAFVSALALQYQHRCLRELRVFSSKGFGTEFEL